MKVTNYNKLVRDKVPQIIKDSGKECVCETLPDEEYIKMLNEKLVEEAREYTETGDIEELADMGEVMHAILDYKNTSLEEFQKVRMEKLQAHGGFKDRILLKEVIEK
ncbi:MAG: nucleoside triphosphate pyrophosphohydrolase [Anaerovoracaceae bacterium]|nr:nucleoside triphosphate pyrophosphohydrolase [Clostridiales bacterium]